MTDSSPYVSAPETAPEEPAISVSTESGVWTDPTAPATTEPTAPEAEDTTQPVHPDSLPPTGNIKSDDLQPLLNHFVEITAGDHVNQYGVFTAVAEKNDDGLPTKVLVKLRDYTADYEFVVVGYDEIAATTYNGGR